MRIFSYSIKLGNPYKAPYLDNFTDYTKSHLQTVNQKHPSGQIIIPLRNGVKRYYLQ